MQVWGGSSRIPGGVAGGCRGMAGLVWMRGRIVGYVLRQLHLRHIMSHEAWDVFMLISIRLVAICIIIDNSLMHKLTI